MTSYSVAHYNVLMSHGRASTTYGIRVKDALLVEIREYACLMGVSINGLIVEAIEHALECKDFGKIEKPVSEDGQGHL